MLTDALVARKYLAPSTPAFWRWDDAGGELVTPAGTLLAFRTELADALSSVEDGGLPPMGALLLVLDAMKGGWPERKTLEAVQSSAVAAYERDGRYLPQRLFASVSEQLAEFHALARGLDEAEHARAALRLVFEGCVTEVPADQSGPVVEVLRAGPPAGMLADSASGDGFDRLLLDLRTLDAGLGRVTADAVRRFAQTGLEAPVLPADELDELPPASEAASAMIESLCSDEQHAALGRLARDLLAALRLPRGLGRPRDLPLGGLSDITNRGQLDRLLLTELAQDDLTLAVRVASNEALYLRREEARTRPPIHRQVVIDLGLRQWGVPRVISTAAALALCAGGDADITVACHTATPEGAEPADPFTPGGLDALLAKLPLNLSPAPAIDALGQALADDPAGELVVISSADVARDAAVARALAALRSTTAYLVAVDRDGRVELSERTAAGSRTIARVTVDPDTLLDRPKQQAVPITDPSLNAGFPAAIRQPCLPLRVPHQFGFHQAWARDNGGRVYVLTPDRRLTCWDAANRGPLQLADNLPKGKLLWCAPPNADTPIDAIFGHAGKDAKLHTLRIDLETDEVTAGRIELDDKTFLLGVTCHRGTILAVTRKYAYAVDPLSGHVLARSGHQASNAYAKTRMDGRYLQVRHGHWSALGYDGHRLTLERVAGVGSAWRYGSEFARLIDPVGLDGTVAVLRSGAVYRLPGDDAPPVKLAKETGTNANVEASRDGWRLRIQTTTQDRKKEYRHLVLGAKGESVASPGRPPANAEWLEPAIRRRCLRRSPRVKFNGLQFGGIDDGRPVLELTTHKAVLHLELDEQFIDARVSLRTEKPGKRRPNFRLFRPMTPPAGTHYRLAAVQFGDQGRIVLDSRGMLHLQPEGDALPEATLVLDESRVSGWCSDGRCFGDPYYFTHQDAPRLTDESAYHSVIRPILEHFA